MHHGRLILFLLIVLVCSLTDISSVSASAPQEKSIEQGESIKLWYFGLTVLIAAFIGGALGNVFEADYRVAGITGFVGTDILENVTKASFGRNLSLKKT